MGCRATPQRGMMRGMERSLSAMVLAAGEGTRMRSSLAKPLHRLCGRAMLLYVLDSLRALAVGEIAIVVGPAGNAVVKEVSELWKGPARPHFVEQHLRRGTGDAVAVGLTGLESDEGDLLVLPGDTPLVRPSTIASLIDAHRRADVAATVLVATVEEPTGYGRVLRSKSGHVSRIVEEADAGPAERAVKEVNTSVYCFRRSLLAPALRRLAPDNAQGEYYLTDVLGVLADAGYSIQAHPLSDPSEAMGVNDRSQLAAAEAMLRRRINERWMRRGVTMTDPTTTYVDADVTIEEDVVLQPGVALKGTTSIAGGAEIGPDTTLEDTTVGEEAVVIRSHCAGAVIGAGARVGPFAVLEPGASVAPGASLGPFGALGYEPGQLSGPG